MTDNKTSEASIKRIRSILNTRASAELEAQVQRDLEETHDKVISELYSDNDNVESEG
jgi:hypothetical protein